MNLRNKVQLIGYLGANPEVVTLESGKKLVKFSLATNERYRNAKGDRVQETQWHSIVAWNKTADIVEKYLIKGSEIAIQGKLVNRKFEDQAGVEKQVTEIIVADLLMLGSKPK